MKRNKGFVVSGALYPLLILFLAIFMSLLSMTDTRKRILDKMKLEISESIFDEEACSCDTILSKLNYLIKNGVSGGGTGSYTHNVLGLNVKGYESPGELPNIGNSIGDIAVMTDVEIANYYVSNTRPSSPKEGTVWIVQDNTSVYYITSDYSKIGISYVMQYIDEKWVLKKSYVYDEGDWTLLYYVSVKDGIVDLTSTDVNAEVIKEFEYTGEYQVFTARFPGYYKIELWGAQGRIAQSSNGIGGKGAYTSGEIYLDIGEQIYIYVGGTTTSNMGGWNGGGDGYNGSNTGGGGGGATDVRLVSTSEKNVWNEFESLKSRIMVAAGGGGAAYYNNGGYTSHGGAGGTLTGNNGTSSWEGYVGTGATQAAGGYLKTSNRYNLSGDFGLGAKSGTHGNGNGGGGGGYYGGGGGSGLAGGGGGSSYISGYEGCSSIEEESIANNIIHNGASYHYSNYYFENPKMIAGNSTTMPTYDGNSTMTGNSGNGHAKITLKTIEMKDDSILLNNIDNKKQYSYYFSSSKENGRYQIFTAPENGIYNVQLWGAKGGEYGQTSGNGAYTTGNIYLEKGKKIYVYVGEMPINVVTGGWNGGGDGYNGNVTGKGGGGATDLRLVPTSSLSEWNEFESLKSRIMVAAGGGGSSYYSGYSSVGGNGGGLIGSSGTGSWEQRFGTGATQSSGGYLYINENQLYGNFGVGAKAGTHANSGGGGGGGYYGGGGGNGIGGGGGGSSYISGYEGCSSIEEESTASNIIHNGSAYHYSGYFFEDESMSTNANTKEGKAIIKLIEVPDTKPKSTMKSYLYYYSGDGVTGGRYQTFTAPVNGTYRVELWGAKGGEYGQTSGNGAYTSGEIYLKSNTKLYVYVGSFPGRYLILGGWNGGGNGYNGNHTGRGGGGATDIRVVPTTNINLWNEVDSLKSRIMVAAGGGGSSYYSGYSSVGGNGGGLIGLSGTGSWMQYFGTGGTQISGGHLNTNTSSLNGQFGAGSIAGTNANSGGGGGGGYYGGGGGNGIGGGGGGSSYISGHAGCIAVDSDGNPKVQEYATLSDSISYTGYKFTNTQMIDGAGYPWTMEKTSTSSGMPSPSNSSFVITGNSGSGYARITYLGA